MPQRFYHLPCVIKYCNLIKSKIFVPVSHYSVGFVIYENFVRKALSSQRRRLLCLPYLQYHPLNKVVVKQLIKSKYNIIYIISIIYNLYIYIAIGKYTIYYIFHFFTVTYVV